MSAWQMWAFPAALFIFYISLENKKGTRSFLWGKGPKVRPTSSAALITDNNSGTLDVGIVHAELSMDERGFNLHFRKVRKL